MYYYITYTGCCEIEADTLEEAKEIFLNAAKDGSITNITTDYDIESINW